MRIMGTVSRPRAYFCAPPRRVGIHSSVEKIFPQKLAAATGFGVFAYSRAGYGASDPVKLPRPLDYMPKEAQDRAWASFGRYWL